MSTKQGRSLRIGSKLAEGHVWEVFELLEYPSVPLGARLVLKKIRPALAQDEGFRNRLLKLFELLPKLRNPYAEEILDASAAGPDETFLVCERLDGESLAALLRREGRLPLSTVRPLARQIAEAMIAGHALCIIHGNLTPGHIVINQPRRDEPRLPLRIKVRGFGLAPPLGGPLYGSPSYLAPEQIDTLSPRPQATQLSDQHALAVLIYEALVGSFLFPRGSLDTVRSRLVRKDPNPFELRDVPQSVIKHVNKTLERALAKVPESRYPRLIDFVESIEGAPAASVLLAAQRSQCWGRPSKRKALLLPPPSAPPAPESKEPIPLPAPVSGPPPNAAPAIDEAPPTGSPPPAAPSPIQPTPHPRSSEEGLTLPFIRPQPKRGQARASRTRRLLPLGIGLLSFILGLLLVYPRKPSAKPPDTRKRPADNAPRSKPAQAPSPQETAASPPGVTNRGEPSRSTNSPPPPSYANPQPLAQRPPTARIPSCRSSTTYSGPAIQRIGSCFPTKLARKLGVCTVKVMYSLRRHEFVADGVGVPGEARDELEKCLNRLPQSDDEFSKLPAAGLNWMCR